VTNRLVDHFMLAGTYISNGDPNLAAPELTEEERALALELLVASKQLKDIRSLKTFGGTIKLPIEAAGQIAKILVAKGYSKGKKQ